MTYERFGLVLMVTHDCNLRCAYCYTGRKVARTMPMEIGRRAIDRAVGSICRDGTLELGFFGGEPLLEARLVTGLVEHARSAVGEAGIRLRLSLTTNGTLTDPPAWQVMTCPEMSVCLSHDGLPAIHDRHRRDSDGRGSSRRVLATIRKLLDANCDIQVATVVRPDTVEYLPQGLAWLREQGVRQFVPTLDLWTRWRKRDGLLLSAALAECADLWADALPQVSISWFDEKAARLARVPRHTSARCGFGDGEVAVASSGRLYPCERLIGEDLPDNRMRLADRPGPDFCAIARPADTASCSACVIHADCDTNCRCANYVRTGDVRRPDGLLCLLNQVCYRETARVLNSRQTNGSLAVLPEGRF